MFTIFTSHSPQAPLGYTLLTPCVPYSFILFYPFCAIFTLYEHIIASPDPSSCAADLVQLECVAAAMEYTSATIRADLRPFTKTIQALNKVARTVQDSRMKSAEVQSVGGLGGAPQLPDALNTTATVVPELDLSAFDTWPDFPMTMDGDPDPLGYVRALENDLIGRNWNGEWWDGNTSVDTGMETNVVYTPTE
jgi:hypothetical protein